MKTQLLKVKEFQESFNLPINKYPTLVSQELAALRYSLMSEENEEYLEAVYSKDIIGIADALGDKLYILLGTILTHGMQDVIESVFNEIHKSNMSKLDENGNPIINGKNGIYDESKEYGKVLKSKNYKEPNLKQFL